MQTGGVDESQTAPVGSGGNGQTMSVPTRVHGIAGGGGGVPDEGVPDGGVDGVLPLGGGGGGP